MGKSANELYLSRCLSRFKESTAEGVVSLLITDGVLKDSDRQLAIYANGSNYNFGQQQQQIILFIIINK